MFCVLKNDKLVIECEKEETALFYICTDSKIEVRKIDGGYAFHKKGSLKPMCQIASNSEADAVKRCSSETLGISAMWCESSLFTRRNASCKKQNVGVRKHKVALI